MFVFRLEEAEKSKLEYFLSLILANKQFDLKKAKVFVQDNEWLTEQGDHNKLQVLSVILVKEDKANYRNMWTR